MARPNTLKDLNVAIVGGSIAGCSAAILLSRLGAKVKVFERSSATLTGRGAGIVLPESFVQKCISLDLLDSDIPRFPISKRSFFVKDNSANTGREIWQQSIDVVGFNWGDIYRNLKERVPSEIYYGNEEIGNIEENDNIVSIETTAGKKHLADLVIAADGVNSFIRGKIFPKQEIKYANYIAWRGMIQVADSATNDLLFAHIPYYVFPRGHALQYHMPASDFKQTGNKLLNWLFYEVCEYETLEKLLIDKDGYQHKISLPPGSLAKKHLDYLHTLARKVLPRAIAEPICQTEKPFMQAIFDQQVPQYVKNKICFIGDAATVLRPHTCSGVLKSLSESISLAHALRHETTDDLSTRLAQWNRAEIANAEQQTTLAQSMGAGLVTNPPDWKSMNIESMESWWQQVMNGKNWYATSPILVPDGTKQYPRG